jgi:hypothetical protein
MYSGGKCGAETYKINYARSKNIWGPYEDAPNNPILTSNSSKKIFGPGHHSVFQVEDEYFIVYHRQDYYHYPTCSERQVCIDRMSFDANGWINEVVPTNKGVDFSGIIDDSPGKLTNIALGKKVTSGGVKKSYNPQYAVDENYATRWEGSKFLSVDLGEMHEIVKIMPRFVHYDYFNLYKILYSNDNINWKTYFDQSEIAKKAYAPLTHKKIEARFVKIVFVRGEGNPATLAELEIFSKE